MCRCRREHGLETLQPRHVVGEAIGEAQGKGSDEALELEEALVGKVPARRLVDRLDDAFVPAGRAERLEATGVDLSRFVLILAVGAAYVAGFVWLGFFTSTVIMVPAVAWMLGYREPKVILLTTLSITLVLYAVFRLLLGVPLPEEALWSLFGA